MIFVLDPASFFEYDWIVVFVTPSSSRTQNFQSALPPPASSKVAEDPPGNLSVCFNGLGRIVNQGVEPSDHIQRIDIASVVCGEARPLRIIVDNPDKQLGLRMCDPDPALVTLNDPRACRDDIPIPSC